MNKKPLDGILNKFANNCDNFEMIDLDFDKSPCNDTFEIVGCSDYINNHLGMDEDDKKGYIKIGDETLDEFLIFRKGMLKLFYTDDDGDIATLVNGFILDAVNRGTRVLNLSCISDILMSQFNSLIEIKYNAVHGSDWFVNKHSFVCECKPEESIIKLAEKIKDKISALKIDVLYIPDIQGFFEYYDPKLQIDTLKYLYNFAFENEICVVLTLSPFMAVEKYDSLFTALMKPNGIALHHLPCETLHKVHFSGNTASSECWDYWNKVIDKPCVLTFKASNGAYNFETANL